MKRFIVLFLIMFLCSCAGLNAFLGIDDKGNPTDGVAPIFYISEVIKRLGPLGILAAGGLSVAGAGYVAHKKGRGQTRAIIKGVQDYKKSLTIDESKQVSKKLATFIPNKYHKLIGKIKDTL